MLGSSIFFAFCVGTASSDEFAAHPRQSTIRKHEVEQHKLQLKERENWNLHLADANAQGETTLGDEHFEATFTDTEEQDQDHLFDETTDQKHNLVDKTSIFDKVDKNSGETRFDPCAQFERTRFHDKDAVYFFTHVPKCAGWSFCSDFQHIKEHTAKFRGGEVCMSYNLMLGEKAGWDRQLKFLRNPRSHVASQYQECKYDDFFRGRTSNLPDDFDAWLSKFRRDFEEGKTSDRETNAYGFFQYKLKDQIEDDFSCYNPINMMTRQLSPDCKAVGQSSLSPHHLAEMKPHNLAVARKRISHAFFVGVTEAYQESLCLLHFKVNGTVPDTCRCGTEEWGNHPMHHSDHKLPARPLSTMTHWQNDTISMISQLDQRLYRHAVKNFVQQVEHAERAVGFRILCRSQRDKLSYFYKLY